MTSEYCNRADEPIPRTLWEVFSGVPDHRTAAGRRYPLPAMLTIAVAAMLCGRQGQIGIVRWSQGMSRADLRALGIRERRPPVASTWCMLFQGLDVATLEARLAAWVQGDRKVLGHIAIDGKRLRGSREGENRGVHLLAAFSEALKGVVGTVAVPLDSSEATEMLTLLKQLPLKGAVVTADAAFTHRPIAEAIIKGGGDYFLVVKGNQDMLQRDIEGAVGPDSPLSTISGAVQPEPGGR
jgi:hypothetical protein